MPWSRPTLTTLVDRAVADMQSRITGATTLLRRSSLKVLARVQAGANHLLYGYIQYLANNLFISKADEIGLAVHAGEYGVDRKAAAAAAGNAGATGTNGIEIPAATELQSNDGQVYTVDTAVTVVGGIATLALTAQQTGTNGNQDAATVLSYVSPIIGIDSTATVDSDGIIDGLGEEEVEDWRARLLARKRQPPHGGAESDYVAWALEVTGVTRAWVFPQYFGIGTVGLAFVRDDDASIIPSAAELEAVYDYVISHEDPVTGGTVGIPVTAEPGFYVIGHNDGSTFAEKSVDLSLKIYPNTTAVQAAVTEKLADVLEIYGGPGETVYLSDIYFIIGGAADLQRLQIVSPVADITASESEVHVPGTITFAEYT